MLFIQITCHSSSIGIYVASIRTYLIYFAVVYLRTCLYLLMHGTEHPYQQSTHMYNVTTLNASKIYRFHVHMHMQYMQQLTEKPQRTSQRALCEHTMLYNIQIALTFHII